MLLPWKCCQQKGREAMGALQGVAQALGVVAAAVVTVVGISSLNKGVSSCSKVGHTNSHLLLPTMHPSCKVPACCCQPGALYTSREFRASWTLLPVASESKQQSDINTALTWRSKLVACCNLLIYMFFSKLCKKNSLHSDFGLIVFWQVLQVLLLVVLASGHHHPPHPLRAPRSTLSCPRQRTPPRGVPRQAPLLAPNTLVKALAARYAQCEHVVFIACQLCLFPLLPCCS